MRPSGNGRRGEGGAGGSSADEAGERGVGAPATQRLIALFGAACLLFNFPLLALWKRDAVVFGVPLFPVALFTVWAVLIGLLAWIVERADE